MPTLTLTLTLTQLTLYSLVSSPRPRYKYIGWSQGIYFLKLPNGILQPIDHTATHTATQTAARDVLCKNLNNHAADSTAPVCCSSLVLARACKCDFDFLACIFQQFWIFINNKSLRLRGITLSSCSFCFWDEELSIRFRNNHRTSCF